MINDFSLQINETQGLMNKDLQYDKNLNPFNRTKFKSNENQMKILSELIERESPIKEEETFTQTKEKDTVLMVTKNRSNKAIFKTDNNALPKENIHLLAKEIFKQRIEGMKDEHGINTTQTFPKLLYVLDENNIHKDSEYYWLTELAMKSTALRQAPDYQSAKVMKELYGDVFPCINKACA